MASPRTAAHLVHSLFEEENQEDLLIQKIFLTKILGSSAKPDTSLLILAYSNYSLGALGGSSRQSPQSLAPGDRGAGGEVLDASMWYTEHKEHQTASISTDGQARGNSSLKERQGLLADMVGNPSSQSNHSKTLLPSFFMVFFLGLPRQDCFFCLALTILELTL